MNDQLLQLGVKKRNKEISMSWQEIADQYSNGLFNNGETLRCWVKDQLRKTGKLKSQVNKVATNDPSCTANEFIKEKEELLKLKTQYQDQKREYTSLIRQQARFEHLKEEIHSSILSLSKNRPLLFIPPSPARSNVRANTLWSDWHVGADFKNSLNRYDLNVFRDRLQVLISKIIHEGKKYNVDTLTIGALGDFISGAIHVSTRVQANEDVIKQIQIVSESISESLAELSKHFRSIKFVNIIGNHARLISNKNESIFTENLENLIPWFLEARLKDFKNIEIYRDTDGYYVDYSFEQAHVYVHGDLDHVASTAKALPQMLGIVPRYIFCGHIHHDTVKEHGRTKVISNGSMIGVDDYAISKRFYAEPMQKMHIFDDQDRIEHSIDIYLN
ncbi:hypothetical protein P4H70_14900 [Paenibacillus ehimensis]|uniref:hypothetical protein n=1 Tax=Paenibacillus ehimensis TaxID=79264 RepID=UPI002DBDA75E|nr:hypothetical protein [Paenibacillus ehimensis]MEC0210224.1 hypothetical protein [Paenibacillus ehimensis]